MIPPTRSKTIFDAAYKQRLAELKTVDREKCHESKWFKQSAYTSCEMLMQMVVTVVLTIINYVIIGFKYRILILAMKKCPQVSPTPMLCEGVGSLIPTFAFMYLCFFLALLQKSIFYKILGLFLGMESLTLMDDI